ncbi:MAG: hypothetical protein ACI9EW_001584 [Cellvibrionaceae bacterium]|jgi:hypothetical protein
MRKKHFRFVMICLIGFLMLAVIGSRSQEATAQTNLEAKAFLPFIMLPSSTPNTQPESLEWGINFMNSVDHPADSDMLNAGKSTGAGWNRWPLYWHRIEKSPGIFDWAEHDLVVNSDITNGFKIDGILLGTPGFYLTGRAPFEENPKETTVVPAGPIQLNTIHTATPKGVYEPIFTDGSDVYSTSKTINPNNKWAVFVFEIVNRYKPGGILAIQNNWAAGIGITHWEMWNEPDFSIFWDGTQEDYARLLKVGYMATKQADRNANILTGGLANVDDPEYYSKLLTILQNDPDAAAYDYFHDIFATHSYSNSWQSWFHVWKAKKDMTDHGIKKDVWLNESGVPVWNDYPGPVWDSKSQFRGSLIETSDYIIQSAFYGRYAGANAIFHFQLFDGCGNQPAFTDFPPHNGELCDGSGNYNGKPCAGDAYGLFRNQSDTICFSQHPQAGTARPESLAAFQILTNDIGEGVPYWRTRQGEATALGQPIEIIGLYRHDTKQRVLGIWNRFGTDQTASILAVSDSAILIGSDGIRQTITPNGGNYVIPLRGATNQNFTPDGYNSYMISGETFVLIETLK